MTKFDFKKLVDVEYLSQNRDNDNLVVIDARGGMLEEGALMYDRATVVDWTDISLLGEFGGEELGKLLTKENYQQIFAKLNITPDSEVLVYGFTMPDQGFGDEGRIIYTFNYVGFDNVKIIDGGFKQVEKLGFNKKYNPKQDRINVSDIERKEAVNNRKAIFTDELLSLIGQKDVQIIDTRLEVEYNGRVIYGENKAGHIPNAISLPFNSLVDENGFIKTRVELEQYVKNKGLDKHKQLITYCTTGVRAAYVAIILEELGYSVRNYEPSFAKYANVGEVENK
ncbi:rhodanese-like protein [Gemella bergeri ATCC 700627]|uniref:thiosulfate sulfurtransferase n=1 Tax=Gemella bergeri ATCC 700627 TaxID=1321820 RepID=U2S3E4_9BACL|nr:rhodanese-like domain-containing protein [Gemella bergeri]ERK60243.1 rhodanese-like protein [Gemella bergeri ATCC 700627]